MPKLWLVAKHEYRKMVRKKSFLIATLGVPLLIIAATVVIILVAINSEDSRPLGYVDHAGILRPDAFAALGDDEKRVTIRAYPDKSAARAALEAEEIQAYYVIPADYLQQPTVERYYLEKTPGREAGEDFWDFMRAGLVLQQLPEETQARAFYGAALTVRTGDGKREIGSHDGLSLVMPFAGAIFFFIVVLSGGGYMLQAVTDEKENRTMEILATSLSPEQLIGGKAIGLMAVALTQVGVWIIALAGGLLIGAQFVAELRGLQVPWGLLGITALYFFPAYALVSGLMTVIGASVTEVQQGQQISGIINMLFTFPMFFLSVLIAKPNSPLAIALSLFPTTSFTTILLRWGLTVIPFWQLAVSWLLLVASAAGSVWLAARVFRLGMLRYGQRLSLKGILTDLRESRA